jgi:uncharacterized membrane protein
MPAALIESALTMSAFLPRFPLPNVLMQIAGTPGSELAGGASDPTTIRAFEWLSAPPAWVLLLLIVPATLFFVSFVYRRERVAEGSRRRFVMGALRVAVFLAVVAMLAEPVLRTTRFLTEHSTLVVLIDDSLSMDLADKYSDRDLVQRLSDFFESSPETMESTTRYDLVRRLLRSSDISLLEQLRGKGNVAVFSFAGGVQRLGEFSRREEGDLPIPPEDLEVVTEYTEVRRQERVRQTRLSDAILEAVASVRGGGFLGHTAPVSGVLVFTDGQQTAGSRAPSDVARRLGQRDIPIFTIGVGNPNEGKDIRAMHLEANEIVLAGDRVPFDVSVIADGYAGERLRVDLKFDGQVVDTEYFVVEGGGSRQSIRLEHRPPKPGDFTVTAEVEHQSGELFAENNIVSKPVRVLEQKIRVLYADGPPRWEYRYLKNALVRDPTMEAQIYLFSADKEFVQESSAGVPPLRSFPRTREELLQYHVIILGDIDVQREIANGQLDADQVARLNEFVYDGGGGVVFVAGPNANPSKYLHTEWASLVPVQIPESGGLAADLRRTPISKAFNVQLTAVGRQHTVMRLENDMDRNSALWENPEQRSMGNLPGFYWFAETGPENKSAVVLARHPDRVHPVSQKGLVVFAYMNYGKGRTFFSAVENTWRWRAGVDNRYFYRFWGQVVRFCATGRLYGKTPRFRITSDKLRYALGETVDVECRIFDANMKPSTDPTAKVYHLIRTPGGEVREELTLQLNPVRGQGTYQGSVVADRVGVHDLWFGTEAERLAGTLFEVEVPALEMRDPRRNQNVLEEMAKLSGGKNFELYQVKDMVAGLEAVTQSQQGDIEDDAAWDEYWVLFAITGLLAAEWILRKIARLL